jgi:hypothetical protein
MKIWNSYGSEHSANLVMIGTFKDVASAEDARDIINEISNFVLDTNENHEGAERYSQAELDLLKRVNVFYVRPEEFGQFRYDIHWRVEGNSVIIKTDETEISAFLKILVEKGARVEVYSAHDYPSSGLAD